MLFTAPPPGYCTGVVKSITPATFGSGVIGSGGITVAPGDVVVLEDGTYTDTNGDGGVMRITGSGTPSQWITVVSRNRWGAKIWAQNTAAEGITLASGADYVRVEGFEVSDTSNGAPTGSSSGIDLYAGGKHSQIVANHVHHTGGTRQFNNNNGQVGIYIQCGASGGSITVENNYVHDIGRDNFNQSHDHAMYVNGSGGGCGGAGNVTIRNNIFHDVHHGWGVQWYPGSLANIHVQNNTFAFCNENKHYTCIVLDASISSSTIKNNIFWNPQGGKTIEAQGFSGSITIGNNLTSGDAMHDQGSTPPGMVLVNNLLNTNPLLVNPPSDFHLQAASPAINAGELLPSVVIDFEGTSRPLGTSHDIGADERQ